MKKRSALILAAALVVVLAAAGFLYTRLAPNAGGNTLAGTQDSSSSQSSQEQEDTSKQSNPAPSFSMEDQEGNTRELSEFLGEKPVYLNFWASTCGPCKSEMPDIHALYQLYGEDIHFILVNVGPAMGDTREQAEAYLEEECFTFPVYYDVDYQAITTYGINSFPFSIFIDAEGNLITYGQGLLSRELLEKGLNMIAPDTVPAPD